MSIESSEPVIKPKFRFNINIQKQQVVVGIIILIALVPSVFFYTQYRQAQSRLANPELYSKEETKKLVDAVAKFMELPSDETPTLATVNDKQKLSNQAFFSHAENGDKVLIYTNAKKAILYRPSINKIIDVAPINIGPANSATASSVQPTATPTPMTFILLNGTEIVGLTRTFETKLKAKVPSVKVLDKDNAKKNDYTKSILIDVKGDKGTQAAQLATELNLTVSALPSGEATPASDFLVILGTDK